MYQKPVVLTIDETNEGVFLASGDIQQDQGTETSQIQCQSKYLNGVWKKPTWNSQDPMIDFRGCEGCSADDGNGCKILKGGELNPDGVFKPTWEQMGYNPDSAPFYNN